jgi:hypothetical protein
MSGTDPGSQEAEMVLISSIIAWRNRCFKAEIELFELKKQMGIGGDDENQQLHHHQKQLDLQLLIIFILFCIYCSFLVFLVYAA